MRILIAEDDVTSRTMLAAAVRKWGYDPVLADDGQAAWDILQQPDAPRLVLLDWLMPGMDGLEVVRQVRALNAFPPPHIIMLTSKSDTTDVITGIWAGADDYLAKPFIPGELRARVQAGRRVIEMEDQLAARCNDLNEATGHIKTLQRLIPVCSSCRKVRNDKEYWDEVKAYISPHAESLVGQAVCPECAKKHQAGSADEHSAGTGTKPR